MRTRSRLRAMVSPSMMTARHHAAPCLHGDPVANDGDGEDCVQIGRAGDDGHRDGGVDGVHLREPLQHGSRPYVAERFDSPATCFCPNDAHLCRCWKPLPVILRYLLAVLVQPMLALLLVAGAQLVEIERAAGPRVQAAERILAWTASTTAIPGEWRRDAAAEPDSFDGDDHPKPAVAFVAPPNLADRTRDIVIGCASTRDAPPSHPPCAAPPTGPPLA